MDQKQKSPKKMILPIIIVVVVVCFLILVIFVCKMFSGKAGDTKNTQKTELTPEQCAEYAEKYDNKVLKITGEGIKGTIGLTANVEECRIVVIYHFLMQVDLPENPYKEYSSQYNYIGLLHSPEETGRESSYGTGYIAAGYVNKDALPEDNFTTSMHDFYAPLELANQLNVTSTFFQASERWYDLTDEGYAEILTKTVYDFIDGKPYIVEDNSNGYSSYSIDIEKAEEKGKIVKTFTFKVTD